MAIDQVDVTGTGGFASAFDVDGAALATAVLANLAFGVRPTRRREASFREQRPTGSGDVTGVERGLNRIDTWSSVRCGHVMVPLPIS
jgi:hypothetical protein